MSEKYYLSQTMAFDLRDKADRVSSDFGMLDIFAIINRVHSVSASKYTPFEWESALTRETDSDIASNGDALFRHLLRMNLGERNEVESTLPHRYHVICRMSMLITSWLKQSAKLMKINKFFNGTYDPKLFSHSDSFRLVPPETVWFLLCKIKIEGVIGKSEVLLAAAKSENDVNRIAMSKFMTYYAMLLSAYNKLERNPIELDADCPLDINIIVEKIPGFAEMTYIVTDILAWLISLWALAPKKNKI